MLNSPADGTLAGGWKAFPGPLAWLLNKSSSRCRTTLLQPNGIALVPSAGQFNIFWSGHSFFSTISGKKFLKNFSLYNPWVFIMFWNNDHSTMITQHLYSRLLWQNGGYTMFTTLKSCEKEHCVCAVYFRMHHFPAPAEVASRRK